MNNFGISDKSYQLIISELVKFPEVEKVVVFGSRAKGNYKSGSDIDLAIIGENCSDKTALNLNGLLNEEIPVPYHIDVVCYNQLKHTELKEHIDRVGITFYEQNKPLIFISPK